MTISKLPSGALIAFISRHGLSHTITPTEVPARANIAALKHVGVQAVVAFSAVGSLREEIAPGHFVIPDQIIDRTKGIRHDTFFRGEGLVTHAMFGDPFSNKLSAFVAERARKILAEVEGGPVELHTGKTVVCMEGRSKSQDPADVQDRRSRPGLSRSCTDSGEETSSTCRSSPRPSSRERPSSSSYPAIAMARADTSYTLICTSTDYDAWRTGEAPVTVEEVVKTLHTNAGHARAIAAGILQDVHDLVAEGKELTDIKGSMRFSCVTRADVS